MKRTSKYLGKQFGDWTCTHVGVATVQAKKKMNHKGLAKRPGHQNYYYIMERLTSDSKAEKMVRLTSTQAAKVYRGELTVEEIAEQRTAKNLTKFATKVSYHFKAAKN